MGIFSKLFSWKCNDNWNYFESDKLYKAFNVEPCITDLERDCVREWKDIYIDQAPWIINSGNTLQDYFDSTNNQLRSLSMAKSVCAEIARLTVLDIDIQVTGSERADYIQHIINDMSDKLHNIVELTSALGYTIFKPSEKSVDIFNAFNVIPIRYDGKKLNECIFIDRINKGKDIYIRCEYHNYIDENTYIIKNKAFISKYNSFDMHQIPLTALNEWQGIQEEINLKGCNHPMYSMFKMPNANNISIESNMPMSCYSGCVQQLEDLDYAYTNFAEEVYNSSKVLFVSQFILDNTKRRRVKLPRFVKGLEFGVGAENTIQEFNPEILVEKRRDQINLLLSFIGYKCGFSNGYFQFSEKTGLITATQIEAEQQQTINTIGSIRRELEFAMKELIECIDYLADLYSLAPKGKYESSFYFKDITSNFEEDRKRNIELVKCNILPKWKYLTEFEGYTEDEARKMVKEANNDGGSQLQDDYGNQLNQLKEQYQKGNKVIEEETEEPEKGINEV